MYSLLLFALHLLTLAHTSPYQRCAVSDVAPWTRSPIRDANSFYLDQNPGYSYDGKQARSDPEDPTSGLQDTTTILVGWWKNCTATFNELCNEVNSSATQ